MSSPLFNKMERLQSQELLACLLLARGKQTDKQLPGLSEENRLADRNVSLRPAVIVTMTYCSNHKTSVINVKIDWILLDYSINSWAGVSFVFPSVFFYEF